MLVASQPLPTASRPRPGLDVGQLFEEHGRFVFRTLRRLGVRTADVEDTVQEVFIVVHRKISQYDTQYSVKGWLFGIAQRVASDYRRRAHVRREEATDEPPTTPSEPPQDRDLARSRARKRLDEALDTLDERRRAVFVLYELEGMSMPEVAEAVGCPVQTAYSRMNAAKKQMRQALEANAVGSPL